MENTRTLLRFVALVVALFMALKNFSRMYDGRRVTGADWFIQALATASFAALTWF